MPFLSDILILKLILMKGDSILGTTINDFYLRKGEFYE